MRGECGMAGRRMRALLLRARRRGGRVSRSVGMFAAQGRLKADAVKGWVVSVRWEWCFAGHWWVGVLGCCGVELRA